jgi:tetratricopeptide (TPR) repeat protein
LPIPEVPHWSSFPFMEALIEYGHALGRAHAGDLGGARKAMDRMRQLRDATSDPKFDYFKRQLDQQMQAASAWVAYGEGKKEDAVTMLRRAADAEDILGKHPVSPGALVPAREQLGDLLLALDRPKEAQQEFEAALKIYPGRFRGLYGAARAAEQNGDKEKARHFYAKLIQQTAKADGSRRELAQLRDHAAQDAAAQPCSVTELGK